MSRSEFNIEDALAACLEGLADGQSLEECLARYPQYAGELAPALVLATRLRAETWPVLSTGARFRGRERMIAAFESRQMAGAWWRSVWGQVGLVLVMLVFVAGVWLAFPGRQLRMHNRPASVPGLIPAAAQSATPIPPAPTTQASVTPTSTLTPTATSTPVGKVVRTSPIARTLTGLSLSAQSASADLTRTATPTPPATPSAVPEAALEEPAGNATSRPPDDGNCEPGPARSPEPTRDAEPTRVEPTREIPTSEPRETPRPPRPTAEREPTSVSETAEPHETAAPPEPTDDVEPTRQPATNEPRPGIPTPRPTARPEPTDTATGATPEAETRQTPESHATGAPPEPTSGSEHSWPQATPEAEDHSPPEPHETDTSSAGAQHR